MFLQGLWASVTWQKRGPQSLPGRNVHATNPTPTPTAGDSSVSFENMNRHEDGHGLVHPMRYLCICVPARLPCQWFEEGRGRGNGRNGRRDLCTGSRVPYTAVCLFIAGLWVSLEFGVRHPHVGPNTNVGECTIIEREVNNRRLPKRS